MVVLGYGFFWGATQKPQTPNPKPEWVAFLGGLFGRFWVAFLDVT